MAKRPASRTTQPTPTVGTTQPTPTVGLMLQGGGALGAYHIGAYQALAEQNLHPDWVAGISIGAINAAMIAGNPPDDRVDRLDALWEAISWPDLPPPVALKPGRRCTTWPAIPRRCCSASPTSSRPGRSTRICGLPCRRRRSASTTPRRHDAHAAAVRRFRVDQSPRRAAQPGRDQPCHRQHRVFRQPPAGDRASACAGELLAAAGVPRHAGGRHAVLGRRLRFQLAAGRRGG